MAQESRLIISIDARNAERTARELSRELDNIQNSGNRADRQVNQLGSSLRSLAGYMAGIVTVGAAINKMDAYANLQNRLRLVTNSQKELNQATSDTFAIAQKTYQSWDSVVQVYQRFSDNAKTLKIDMQQTAKLTEVVSKAVAISGASTQAAEAALTQFGQALASGTLRGEELNSVMEQTPALAKAIASGMGITVGQLRTVAAEGKITSEVLVKALGNAAQKVDEDFSKMQMTIGQSITLLDNQLAKFAESSGGAANVIGGSIKTIAENLELISSAAMIAGIGYLTTAIATKTVAVSADVAASVAQRNATIANAQAELAEATAVVNETKAHLANVKAVTAETQAKFGATQAALQYRNATTAVTVALEQQRIAQQKLSATQAIVAGTGSKLLGVLGGPVGIGLTVASVAASYLLMRDNTAKATAKLDEQKKVAEKTADELRNLEGAQKAAARDDLKASLKDYNDQLKRSSTLIGNYIAELASKNTADAQTAEILLKVRQGVMTYDDALKVLNKTHADSPDIIKKLTDEINKYKETSPAALKAADGLSAMGEKSKIAGNNAENAATKIDKNTDSLNDNADAATKAAKAQDDFFKSLNQQALGANERVAYMSLGYTSDVIDQIQKLQEAKQKALGDGGTAIITNEDIAKIKSAQNALDGVKDAEDAITEAKRKQKKLADDALRAAERARKEAEQLAKEQGEARIGIAYNYLDELQKMEEDYQREIAEIRKANFGAEQAEFERKAKERYDFQHEMYLIQMTEEINSFKWSENEKLNHWKRTQQEIIENSGRYNAEMKELKLKALNEEYLLEKAKIELTRKQREFQAREQFMTETEAMKERYILEEAQILLINDAHERAHLLELKRLEKEVEMQKKLNDARDAVYKTQSRQNGTEEFDAIYNAQAEANNNSANLMDLEVANGYKTQEQAQLEHLERMKKNAQEAHEAMLKLQFGYGEQIAGSMADMFKTMGGEQSKAYKVMFAASKAFAIAQSAVAISQGIAQAAANPWPLNLAAMASVAAATASIISNIKSVADVGFKTGGYTGNGGTSDVAGVVHGQEYVLNAAATKRVGKDTLDAINSGGSLGGTPVNITINTPAGFTATTKQDGNGVTIDVVEQKINQAFQNVRKPSSDESRVFQSTFGLQPAR